MLLRGKIFSDARIVLMVLCLISVFSLGGAYGAEHFFGLKPCVLCLYQRYAYMVAGSLALLGVFYPKKEMILAVGLAFLIGGGIAFYQVGIEWGIFQLPSICKTTSFARSSIGDMKDQLLHQPLVSCDKPAWEMFGISMAGYNGLFSLCLLIYSWIAFRKTSS